MKLEREILDRLNFLSGQVAEFVRNLPYRTVVAVNLDGNGNGQGLLFECREFTTFRLHRVVLQTVAHGPANPYASVTGSLGLYRNDVSQPGNLIDFVPAGQTMFPTQFVAATDAAEVLQPASTLSLQVAGGPPNDTVLARVQGVLHPDWRVALEHLEQAERLTMAQVEQAQRPVGVA